MTNQEILIKATDKARANGYEFWDNKMCPNCDRYIFSHDFAKALWGDTQWNLLIDRGYTQAFWVNDEDVDDWWLRLPAWQYHLQQMVLEENPVQYLAKFL